MIDLKTIREAATIVGSVFPPTPIIHATIPTSAGNCTTVLKLETAHRIGSFKGRGAAYKLHQLKKEGGLSGVVAMSAGNHAQGVAMMAHVSGIPAIIVMPEDTPTTKIDATEQWGAEVILAGATVAEAMVTARKIQSDTGYAFMHPYDDPDIIIGQATCGLELYDQAPQCSAAIIPIGGGGLACGMAQTLKQLNPHIKLYGVETDYYPSMKHSMEGHPHVFTTSPTTLAEGIAIKIPGVHTQAGLEGLLEDILLVPEAAIESAIFELAIYHKCVTEGAGATAYACLKHYAHLFVNHTTALVITGGNIEPRILSSILLRQLITHHKLIRLSITTKDTSGQLAAISTLIAQLKGNVVRVNHERLHYATNAKELDMDFYVEIRNEAHGQTIRDALISHGFRVSMSMEL